MGHQLDLHHLRAFVVVIESGSYTKAAKKLAVTQPAMSRLVRKLERHVGHRLIDRSRKPLRPTFAGAQLLPYARRTLATFDETLTVLKQPTDVLRFGFSWNAAGRLTTRMIARFETAQPDVQVRIRRFDSAMAGIDDGRSHIAVVRTDPDDGAYERELLFLDPRVAVVCVSHPLAERTELTLHDVHDDPLVANVVSGTTLRELWDDPNPTRRVLPVNNTDEWLHEIALGRGIGVGVASSADFHRHPDIRYIALSDAPPVPVLLAWPRRAPHPLCTTFAAHALETFTKG